MDSRGFLLLALAFISFLMYDAWQKDYAPKPEVQQQQQLQIDTQKPSVAVEEQAFEMSSSPARTTNIEERVFQPSGKHYVLENNVLQITLNEYGDVVRSELKQFLKTKDQKDQLVTLFQQTADKTYTARSMFWRSVDSDTRVPNESTKPAVIYDLVSHQQTASKSNPASIELSWINEDGIEFKKSWILNNEQYHMQSNYQVVNNSQKKLAGRMELELKHGFFIDDEQSSAFGIQPYNGAAYSIQDAPYKKFDFSDFKPNEQGETIKDALKLKTNGGWGAFLQHYFVAAWVPNQTRENTIQMYRDTGDATYVLLIKQAFQFINPGQTANESAILYVGPKDQESLEQIANGLDRTVDYGFLWWIGQPIFMALTFFHSLVANWGFAIILVTILIKILLYPLANAQYRSFAKMRLLQPKMQQLKERFGDDRQKMSMAMMEMYKKEKVNPMGGCLPLIVQMPVFLALYWVLLESYEIRHAPFILWIQDLSAKDPLFILPVLMGASMWAMQKLQPTSAAMDPMQQKIMQYLPVMMTIFFIWFPSGLVLYWLMNNLLSIAQQLYITNKIEKEHHAKKA